LYWKERKKKKSLGGLLAVYQGGIKSFTCLTVFMCIYASFPLSNMENKGRRRTNVLSFVICL